jgi:hypothetical protein
MKNVILRLQYFLTPRRLTYAYLAGAVLWLSWLLSIALGPGNVDLAGQVVGTDYLQFYTAGYTLRSGESAQLYDMAYQAQLEQELIGPELRAYHAFITPPFLAWLFVPFAALPYGVSFALWSLLGLLGLWLSLRLLSVENPRRALVWTLTWFPAFAAISYGQNSILSLLWLSLAFWLWRSEYLFAAGLVCSLALYKPQLIVGVALLWLLEWRRDWRALLGLALGGGVLASLCFWLLPEASRAYVEFARTILPDLPNWQDFPLWHLHTLRGFWRLLLPQQAALADLLTLVLWVGGLWGFARFWQRCREHKALLFAAAICLTFWLTPHAMIYDWLLLLIPAVLLWQEVPQWRERWRALYALVWLATFFSGPLTYVQLQHFPVAVQLSVPVLAVVFYQAYRWLVMENSTFFLLSETN